MDFCLVHLSDFHLRTKTQPTTDTVLNSLAADLKSRIESLDLPTPHIALSGDLAYGGLDEEYAIVEAFLGELTDSLHGRSTVFCGGNHDVNWSLLAPLATELMDGMAERKGGVDAAVARFGVAEDRESMRAGMGPYYSFLRKHGVESEPEMHYMKSLSVANLRLNIISLNSAYLASTKYRYYGYVGTPQLRAAEKSVSSRREPSFNITLVHHPLEAVVPASQEETKRGLLAFSDVILNGHVHTPRVSVEYAPRMLGRSTEGPPPVISCARCVFDEANNPSISSGYSIIGIDFQYEKAASVKVWEGEFDKEKRSWYYDERKQSYPMVVSVRSGAGETEGVGRMVTDAERSFLSRWRLEGGR